MSLQSAHLLDIIGLGIIFPTIVALISYFLRWEDKKIESLHSEIINRLLSFLRHQGDSQTIRSLSLEQALKEIDHILTNGKSSQGDNLRIDVSYYLDEKGKMILMKLKERVRISKRERVEVLLFLILLIILYISVRNRFIKIY